MRIALVHDYIKEYGGAERVLESFHEMYPTAPVYTLLYAPDFLGPHKQRFSGWDIRQSWVGKLPFSFKLVSILRLIAPFVFASFDFSGYDVIIVSATGAYNPNIIQKRSAKQICYCHTPPRYLYGFATAREWKKNGIVHVVAEIANHILRMVDFTSATHVDQFIANSQNVASRIRKFYRRDSVIVYPPVTLLQEKTFVSMKNRTYYLAGGRLARPKHIDLLMSAARTKTIPLKIFGKGFAGYGEELRSLAGGNIELLGEVSDEEKQELMRHAKAFLIAAEDEDFGMVPVEAMSFGTPVIAYNGGGLRESVVEGKTGVFFDELTADCVILAINRFEKMEWNPQTCRKHAEAFSKKRFEAEITKVVQGVVSVKR